MQIFTTIHDIQKHLAKQKNKTIGLVPTMGALHAGHISLVKESKKKCDITVVSVFVNPTQFAPNEDLDKYPCPLEKDKKLLKKENIDALFLPTKEEIYPEEIKSDLPNLPEFTKVLEGVSRPAHFFGVAQVVKRLFEIVEPTDAFFGQKDFQQTLVIKWLIEIYNFNINLHICTIVREKDGLALSSRNRYLNSEGKTAALILKQTLSLTKELVDKGEKNVRVLEKEMQKKIKKESLANLDYAVIRDKNNLDEQEIVDKNSIALIATKIGKTRLIDNSFVISVG